MIMIIVYSSKKHECPRWTKQWDYNKIHKLRGNENMPYLQSSEWKAATEIVHVPKHSQQSYITHGNGHAHYKVLTGLENRYGSNKYGKLSPEREPNLESIQIRT